MVVFVASKLKRINNKQGASNSLAILVCSSEANISDQIIISLPYISYYY